MGRKNCKETAIRRNAALVPVTLALAGLVFASGGESGAYFTASGTARWEQELRLGAETELEEEYGEGTKTIVIENTGVTACFVRAKAFAGDGASLDFKGEGWTEGENGYWYCEKVLEPGDKTQPFYITVSLPEPAGEERFMQLVQNVVVVQECAQVFYRDKEDGTQEAYADWTMSIIEEGED